MGASVTYFYLGVFTSFVYITNAFVKDTLYKTFFSENKKIVNKIAKGAKRDTGWKDVVEKKKKGLFNKARFIIYNIIKINSATIILTFIAIFNWTKYFLIFYDLDSFHKESAILSINER